LNKLLAKAFRSYTNPNATKALFEHFKIDQTLEQFGKSIDPFHTLMYRKYRNPRDTAAHRAQLGLADSYAVPLGDFYKAQGLEVKDGEPLSFFHGTDKMEHYRNIVMQGNMPSLKGTAGEGVYVVDPRSREFAETWKPWRNGKSLLVEL